MKKIFSMNLPEEKDAALRDICRALGAEYAVIGSGCEKLKVADIIDGGTCDTTAVTETVCEGKVQDGGSRKLSMEMALFAGITSKELDIFLDRYRKSGLESIALKSVVTDTNREWTLEKLYSELAREYLFYKMRGR